MYKAIDFLGIEISAITKEEIVDKIIEFAFTGRQKMITYLNAHCVNVSFTDFEYREILKVTDLVYAGGQGVVWASRFLGALLPERVNILDFFDALTEELRKKQITVYLLGNKSDIVKKTEDALKSKGLKIVGSKCGFFNKDEEVEIIKEINALQPNMLMVGMGISRQEKWIQAHIHELNVNLCWAVGAVFDWLSGQRKRAPQWMIKFGIEWVHRLCQQPKRLWMRYLVGNLVFIYHVLKWKIKRVVDFC